MSAMEMPTLGTWLLVLGLYVVLPLLTWPKVGRALAPLAIRINDWATARIERNEYDPEEDELWLMEKRRRLSADLRRVEHLVATDTWMSATRQRANRLAYLQLVEDLRHIPQVSPALAPFLGNDSWDESVNLRSTRYLATGHVTRTPEVEILEIGWRRGRD